MNDSSSRGSSSEIDSLMNDVSYSMIVDNEKLPDRTLNSISQREISRWVRDDTVTECYQCNSSFGLFCRRHHCRMCGRIFCYRCCNNWVTIPKYIKTSEAPSSYFSGLSRSDDKSRVCNPCLKKIGQLRNLYTLFTVFSLVKLDIEDYKVMGKVSKIWRQLSNYYLSKFREIQYYLPGHVYSPMDKKMLWDNKHFFPGHSMLLVHLLKSIDNEVINKKHKRKFKKVVRLIDSKKSCTCWSLMCSRTCNDNISPENALNLLDSSVKSPLIRDYATHFLRQMDDIELVNYIPFLVHSFIYDLNTSNAGEFLVQRSVKNNMIANEVYWQLRISMENREHNQIYKYYYDKLINSINFKVLEKISKGENLITILQGFPKTLSEDEIKLALKDKFLRGSFKNIADPLDPFIDKIGIDIDEMHVKDSATKPFILPINYIDEDNFPCQKKILFKSEDIRKDQIIINIIRLIDLILKKEEKLDLHILTYNVRPITCDSGVIEIVPFCDTIYAIKEKRKSSILNYIIEEECKNVDEVRRRFMKSCAAYCVITYLLGIGDRHLDNIMVTRSGLLFHIDFGFILGFDSKPFTDPNMRISKDMVDALGGINSEYYQEFKKICNRAYNCLRRHINLFINILSLLVEVEPPINNSVRFTKKMILNEITKRFLPGENYKQAELKLYRCIDRSSSDYRHACIDFFHYHQQENTLSSLAHETYATGIFFFEALYNMIRRRYS